MSLLQTVRKPNTLYVYKQTTGLASNRSAHFGIRKQIITKLRPTDSIVNTDKGTRVFYNSCDRYLATK